MFVHHCLAFHCCFHLPNMSQPAGQGLDIALEMCNKKRTTILRILYTGCKFAVTYSPQCGLPNHKKSFIQAFIAHHSKIPIRRSVFNFADGYFLLPVVVHKAVGNFELFDQYLSQSAVFLGFDIRNQDSYQRYRRQNMFSVD